MVDTISRIVVGCTAFNDKKLPILKKPESLKAPLIELSEIKHLGKLNAVSYTHLTLPTTGSV